MLKQMPAMKKGAFFFVQIAQIEAILIGIFFILDPTSVRRKIFTIFFFLPFLQRIRSLPGSGRQRARGRVQDPPAFQHSLPVHGRVYVDPALPRPGGGCPDCHGTGPEPDPGHPAGVL